MQPLKGDRPQLQNTNFWQQQRRFCHIVDRQRAISLDLESVF
ncbi:hypothetical protein [Sphaerothrix gracilis]